MEIEQYMENLRLKLKTRPANVSLKQISENTGLNYYFLCDIAKGEIPHAIEKLALLEKELSSFKIAS